MSDESREKREMGPKWKAALCGLAAGFALLRCDMQTAGTSVGTGNPTEIIVSFQGDSGSESINGTMDVYAYTQIPVPGFSPEPLVRVGIAGAMHAALKAATFQALADSLWPKTSIEDGAYRFNVVVTGEHSGSILKGFSFRRKTGDFVLRAEDAKKALRNENVATVWGAMAPLAAFECSIDPGSLIAQKDHYLFLYGTGFQVKGDSGRFVFPAMPKAAYQVSMVSLPKKGEGGAGANDSVYVYGLTSGIEAGKPNPLSFGPIQDTLPVPESLRADTL
ncbi:MAG: hypothetical protein JWP91_3183 [Fibrobacteres bacterium]|nr:hypothetical protein [Fibrobacterota bacterium]